MAKTAIAGYNMQLVEMAMGYQRSRARRTPFKALVASLNLQIYLRPLARFDQLFTPEDWQYVDHHDSLD
jgi:hypothetical protein